MKISTLCLLILITMKAYGQSGDVWNAFEIDDLLNKRAESQNTYLKFLDKKSLSMGIYVLEKGATDQQKPHDEDEVYYILEGRATLKVEDNEIPIKTGSTLFVKAFAAHSFINIEETLKIMVFFSTGPTD